MIVIGIDMIFFSQFIEVVFFYFYYSLLLRDFLLSIQFPIDAHTFRKNNFVFFLSKPVWLLFFIIYYRLEKNDCLYIGIFFQFSSFIIDTKNWEIIIIIEATCLDTHRRCHMIFILNKSAHERYLMLPTYWIIRMRLMDSRSISSWNDQHSYTLIYLFLCIFLHHSEQKKNAWKYGQCK